MRNHLRPELAKSSGISALLDRSLSDVTPASCTAGSEQGGSDAETIDYMFEQVVRLMERATPHLEPH